VTCPIALFPATSESEKISFNQINKKTGQRIRYLKVDAETGEEVASEDITRATRSIPTSILKLPRRSLRTSRSIHPHH
jgi:DNA end-binding protein Ku